jgi:Inner membrane protein import complex subunit Tim54
VRWNLSSTCRSFQFRPTPRTFNFSPSPFPLSPRPPMSFLLRGITRFWTGTPQRPLLNRHPAPWPAPRRPAFRPTRPPKPTTLVGKVKSYIPGRNWLLFGGVVLTWVGASAYDKRQTELRVKYWSGLVAHLARQTISEYDAAPSVSVWVCAPPGDQLKWNKEVWRKFVKVPKTARLLLCG